MPEIYVKYEGKITSSYKMFAFVKIAYQFCKIVINHLIADSYPIIFTFGDFKSSSVTFLISVRAS